MMLLKAALMNGHSSELSSGKKDDAMTKPITHISDGQRDSVISLVQEAGKASLRELGLDRHEAQRLLGRGGEFKARLRRVLTPLVKELTTPRDTVLVPELDADEITDALITECRLQNLDYHHNHAFRSWDFFTDRRGNEIKGRGQRFESLVWVPEDGKGSYVETRTIRRYFQRRGYFGHTAALIQWVRDGHLRVGKRAYSIPQDDDACWVDYESGAESVPTFARHAGTYSFDWDRLDLGHHWHEGSVAIVGFRQIP